MGKIKIYTSLSGFLLLQEGVSFLGWNQKLNNDDVEIILPLSAVKLSERIINKQGKLEKVIFEVLDKQNW